MRQPPIPCSPANRSRRPAWAATLASRARLALVALAAGGCFLLPREEQVLAPPLLEAPEISYRVLDAERGIIEDKVVVGGVFIYPSQHSLRFRHRAGPLKGIYARYGEPVIAGQLVAELDTDNLLIDIERQQIVLRQAQLDLERLQASGADRFARESAALDVELEQLRLRQLRGELDKSRLLAPIDGEVVYIAPLGEGESVDTFRTVVQIADPREILLSYNGPKRSDFRLGADVEVEIRDTIYFGEVVMTPLNVPRDAPDEMRELILIRVDELPPEVDKGDTATVSLVLARREDVIVLPRNLVQTYLGRRFVYVLADGIREERNVETGIQTPTQVEIVAGLEAGDQVVIR